MRNLFLSIFCVARATTLVQGWKASRVDKRDATSSLAFCSRWRISASAPTCQTCSDSTASIISQYKTSLCYREVAARAWHTNTPVPGTRTALPLLWTCGLRTATTLCSQQRALCPPPVACFLDSSRHNSCSLHGGGGKGAVRGSGGCIDQTQKRCKRVVRVLCVEAGGRGHSRPRAQAERRPG